MDHQTIVFCFLIGLTASFYGSITGGAALLSIPALIFLGIPADVAIASNKLGDLGRFSSATFNFVKSGQVIWKLALIFIPISILGGILGAYLLSVIHVAELKTFTGIIILLFIPLLFINKKMGIEEVATSKTRRLIGWIMYFVATVYGASIQVGSGFIIIYSVTWFFGTTLLQANATSSVAWLFTTISSVISLLSFGLISFEVGLPLFFGSAIGGYLGAYIAVKKGNKWMRVFFIVVVISMALKMVIERFI